MALPTRMLGHANLAVSVVGLGGNNFGRRIDFERTREVLDAALEAGVTFIDTADIYGRGLSEDYIGQALEGRRDEVVLATKFGMDMGDGKGPRGSRDYILQAAEGSLRRLRTNVIDVYWYHQPDGVTPIAETLETLDELVRAGTVRAIGASNFSAGRIEAADAAARERDITRFAAVQNEYSLLARDAERDVLPTCERLGLGFVPYFPLASGMLTGKYRRGEDGPPGARLTGRPQSDERFDAVEELEAFARERGMPLLHLAIGALLARPVISSVIAGATTPEQVRANAAAATAALGADDLAALDAVLAGT